MKFNAWFREQFGGRPTRRTTKSLEADVASLEDRLVAAQDLLARTELWEERRRAALYAWQAPKEEG